MVLPVATISPEVVLGVLALVVTFLTNQYLQRRVEREKLVDARREKIAPLMEQLLGYIRRVGKEAGVQKKDIAMMAEIQTGLLLWGSKPLIESWASWMRLAERQNVTNREALDAMTDLIHTARAEFGHEDEGMAKRDLLRVYVTDIDSVYSADEVF